MARTPTQKEIAAFIVGHGIVDFISGGKLSKIERDALWKVIKKLGPPAARGAVTTAGMVGRAALRGTPAVGVALTGYDAYQRGREDAERGLPYALQNIPAYPFMNPFVSDIIEHDTGRDVGKLDIVTPALRVRKKVSTYAKNVGRAMKAVKISAKGGPKGRISNPKKTFKTVSKTVSRIMKGGTRPRGGITGIISKAVKGSFKRKPKKTRPSRIPRRY